MTASAFDQHVFSGPARQNRARPVPTAQEADQRPDILCPPFAHQRDRALVQIRPPQQGAQGIAGGLRLVPFNHDVHRHGIGHQSHHRLQRMRRIDRRGLLLPGDADQLPDRRRQGAMPQDLSVLDAAGFGYLALFHTPGHCRQDRPLQGPRVGCRRVDGEYAPGRDGDDRPGRSGGEPSRRRQGHDRVRPRRNITAANQRACRHPRQPDMPVHFHGVPLFKGDLADTHGLGAARRQIVIHQGGSQDRQPGVESGREVIAQWGFAVCRDHLVPKRLDDDAAIGRHSQGRRAVGIEAAQDRAGLDTEHEPAASPALAIAHRLLGEDVDGALADDPNARAIRKLERILAAKRARRSLNQYFAHDIRHASLTSWAKVPSISISSS